MKWIEVMQESLTSFYKKAISKAGKDTQEEKQIKKINLKKKLKSFTSFHHAIEMQKKVLN